MAACSGATSTRRLVTSLRGGSFDPEQLCLWLLGRRPEYVDVEHVVGAAGRDRGRNLVACRTVAGCTDAV